MDCSEARQNKSKRMELVKFNDKYIHLVLFMFNVIMTSVFLLDFLSHSLFRKANGVELRDETTTFVI